MSAILSADDLNDFISPGVACIKPVETLPSQQAAAAADASTSNPYEVTTEDKVAATNAPPASISLTDCLACSGCVTSAEAVLVSLQSHNEVLNTLDAYSELPLPWSHGSTAEDKKSTDGKIFVASVSPQTRASIAATYGVSEKEAGHMITQLLSGPLGLRATGAQKSGFTWVMDTNVAREIALVAAADEVMDSLDSKAGNSDGAKRPILTSACPGWICYAEKTHPHVLPHISRLKSPQALTGTLVKSVLARKFGVDPDKVWHLAVMPCFDKKLEASREELTDVHWQPSDASLPAQRKGIRDVDCVITARELLMLAEQRGIAFPSLPKRPLKRAFRTPFPDPDLNAFLFPPPSRSRKSPPPPPEAGTSGGYLYHTLLTFLHHARASQHPNATLHIQRGRNADVVEYTVLDPDSDTALFKAARYYGFRNIQNLVRRLKPAKPSRLAGAAARMGGGARKPGMPAGTAAARKPAPASKDGMTEYAYVEVMACPGGCTNGGGQIKVGDVGALRAIGSEASGIENGGEVQEVLPLQKEWLGRVDEAYFSASSSDEEEEEEEDADGDVQLSDDKVDTDEQVIDGISRAHVHRVMQHWANLTDVELQNLVYTSYRKVESEVGKSTSDVERVAGLASSIGGGW